MRLYNDLAIQYGNNHVPNFEFSVYKYEYTKDSERILQLHIIYFNNYPY